MTLSSPAFADGGQIPLKYSQLGAEVSPPLVWSTTPQGGVGLAGPAGTAGFVLLVQDLNAPEGNDGRLHWLVWNIPPNATSLAEGISHGPVLQNGIRQISRTGPYYRGPAALPTDQPHHLLFELFAVDTIVDVQPAACLPADRCTPESSYVGTRAAVMAAIQGHIVGKAVLFGLFSHPNK
jgi:phosphatidylethanolamine-binding protein (PEBP) family uncharacterized protein